MNPRRKPAGRKALTLVEIMVSATLFVMLIAGVLAALVLSMKMQRRSQSRLEAFTLASFLADQLRLATPGLIDIAARGAGSPENTIDITLPPNVLPAGVTTSTGARNYKIRVMGASPVSALDINDSSVNYAQDWMDKNPTSWWSSGTRRNALQIDLRTQQIGTDNASVRVPYQAGVPVNTSARAVSSAGQSAGFVNANAVVIIQRTARTTPSNNTFIDYNIRVDVALDKKNLPTGQACYASARTYVCPTIFSSPNVLLVK